jgi:6-phosphofructokinase 2
MVIVCLSMHCKILATPEQQIRIPGLTVDEASSIGAEDSFVAGMTLALQRGKNIHRAFVYGMAAGTAALGTQDTELCRKDDGEKFYRQLPETQGEAV